MVRVAERPLAPKLGRFGTLAAAGLLLLLGGMISGFQLSNMSITTTQHRRQARRKSPALGREAAQSARRHLGDTKAKAGETKGAAAAAAAAAAAGSKAAGSGFELAPGQYLFFNYTGSDAELVVRTCGPEAQYPNPTRPLHQKNKVVSSIIFNTEVDLLLIRMLEHDSIMDHFVVIESPLTFSGKPKPLHFEEALCQRFGRYLPKIVHVVVDPAVIPVLTEEQSKHAPPYQSQPWKREYAARNALAAVGGPLGLQAEDLVLSTDVDEIALLTALLEAAHFLWNYLAANGDTLPIIQFSYLHFYFSLYHMVDALWPNGNLFPYKLIQSGCNLQQVRATICTGAMVIRDMHEAGIHLSWAFPPEGIALKIASYSHVEHNQPKYTDVKAIKGRIREGWHPFDEFQLVDSDPERKDELFRFTPEAYQALLELSTELRRVQELDRD